MDNDATYGLQAKLFRGFSDDSRLAILEALREGPLPVGRIVEVTGLSQSNTSNHLRCLSECGLVAAEQRAMLGRADELLAALGGRIFECTNYARPTKPDAAPVQVSAQPQRRR